jgi:hypothetical protein
MAIYRIHMIRENDNVLLLKHIFSDTFLQNTFLSSNDSKNVTMITGAHITADNYATLYETGEGSFNSDLVPSGSLINTPIGNLIK